MTGTEPGTKTIPTRAALLGGAALLLCAGLAACGDAESAGDGGSAAPQTYDSKLEAPDRSEYDGQDDVSPTEDARQDLELDSGARVVIYVDPDQIDTVYEQHSDPEDDSRWTAPNELYSGGDGCLYLKAATDGELVAATLGCYGTDAFIQQAPDEGQAVVSTDLAEWDVEGGGELYEKPTIAEDGDSVTWPDGPTWTRDGGFE